VTVDDPRVRRNLTEDALASGGLDLTSSPLRSERRRRAHAGVLYWLTLAVTLGGKGRASCALLHSSTLLHHRYNRGDSLHPGGCLLYRDRPHRKTMTLSLTLSYRYTNVLYPLGRGDRARGLLGRD